MALATGFFKVCLMWDVGEYFCMGEEGPSLQVRILTAEEENLFMQVTLDTYPEQSPCAGHWQRTPERMWSSSRGRAFEVLPDLLPPGGAMLYGGGSSTVTGGRGHSDIQFKTDIGLKSVLV